MAKQIKWTKKTFEDFCTYGMLNSDEIYILESRIKGTPISIQASHLCCSESTVSRTIAMMKKRYDAVQKQHPDLFPPRKYSAKETWMDEH